jgi:hypothetical protein
MTRRVRVTSSTPPWGFRASMVRPHDGDSFFMLVDCGFSVRYQAELRLDGVHAPEIHPMQPGGQETLDFVNGWLTSVQQRDSARSWPFWIEVVATSSYEPGMDMSFTRYVSTVWDIDSAHVFNNQANSLNQLVSDFLAGHPEWPSGD